MESNNIREILDSYYNGETTLDQEKALAKYFYSIDDNLDKDLLAEKQMFMAFSQERCREVHFPLKKKRFVFSKSWQIISGIAAMLVITIGIGTYQWVDYQNARKQRQYQYMQMLKAFNILSKTLSNTRSEMDCIGLYFKNVNELKKR